MHLAFFVSGLFAEIIGTTVGFGSSTIFLPLALLFFDFKPALVLVAFLHMFGGIGRISFFRHSLDRNLIIMFGMPSVLFTVLGSFLVALLPQLVLKGLLGLFLIAYSALSLWKDQLKIRASANNAIIGGSLSGFIAGLIGTGGALRGAFLTAFHLPKEKYIATAAAIALAVDITRTPVYLNQGFLTNSYYWYVPVLFVIAISGSYIGKHIVNRIPQERFQKAVLIALLVIGVKFVFDWIIS